MPEARIGDRIRQIRERQGLSQDIMAKWLGVSRSMLVLLESGDSQPGLAVLEKLAYRLGCDLRTLVSGPAEIDSTLVMLRADPALEGDVEAYESIQKCLRIGEEVAHLESLLGIDRAGDSHVRYPAAAPSSKMDAVRQGERAAASERRRMGLGEAPIDNMVSLLEGEGICTSQTPLSGHISGVSILSIHGVFVFVNGSQPVARRRFSFAHEYAHVILDLRDESRVVVSLESESNLLLEVRANAFAAAFLAPDTGCRTLLQESGKGRPSRVEYSSFGGGDRVLVNERNVASEQSIQPYDILLLARHFGVSPDVAAFRLSNLGFLDDEERDRFLAANRSGALASLKKLVREPVWFEASEDFSFSSRMLGLALEARRRGEITTGRLIEIAELVNIDRVAVEEALTSIGADE
jgi:Zn-dependent peptidase ImmA (M78 family)/transcriptional regulator with XRE-family HTH domain